MCASQYINQTKNAFEWNNENNQISYNDAVCLHYLIKVATLAQM